MRPTFRKLEVKDIGNLEQLVAENVEGVEPGLKIVDSRLLLGQAAIDLVGLDSKGSLVLIALDFSADDGLLLRVMDAYSWCLEYPDTLRRLYPMARASSRPPRILFIVEKMTDAFLRRLRQLSFLEIDCFEFRHLEVNGASVVYFDLVESLRKIVESTSDTRSPAVSAPTAPTLPVAAPVPVVAPIVEPRVAPLKPEPAKPAIEWPTRVESREAESEPKPVEPPKAVALEPVRLERPVVAVVEPVAPVAVPPVAAAPSAPTPVEEPKVVVDVPPPVPEFQSVKLVTETVAAAPPAREPIMTMPAGPALELQAIETTSTRAHANGHVHEPVVAPALGTAAPVSVPVEGPIVAAPAVAAAPPVIAAPPVVAAPAVVAAPEPPPAPVAPAQPVPAPVQAPVQAPPVWAKPGSQPTGARPHFFAQATKGTAPVEAPAMVAAVAAAAEPATQPAASKVGLEVDDRPELESLSFPKDGLSRQWLEFLSQLGATK